MSTKLIQRTVLIGVGPAGAITSDRLFTKLSGLFGNPSPISALAILADDPELEPLTQPVVVIPDPGREAWSEELAPQLEQTLVEISQVSALDQLAQFGYKLDNPGEIHLLLLLDLTETGLLPQLGQLVALVREHAFRRLSCRISVTGVLLHLAAGEDAVSPNGTLETGLEPLLQENIFDRGCFIVGPTNEAGLIVGQPDTMVRQVTTFLSLLLTDIGLVEQGSAALTTSWGPTLTSFGLAQIDWPAEALVETLSKRWSQTHLNEQMLLSGPEDPAKAARSAVQQWLTAQKLAPPLLINHLETQLPPAPNYMAELVPNMPWPWLLIETSSTLNEAAGRWQERWLSLQSQLQTELATLAGQWPAQVQTWLQQELARRHSGGLIWIYSYLAAISEMLRAILEGVEQKLDEAQTDLVHLDQQVQRAEDSLAAELEGFPPTIPHMLLRWGLLPLRWPRYALRCRRGRKLARNLAHVLRSRLLVWQSCSFQEAMLTFYHQLLADWEKIVTRWTAGCEQIRQAGQQPDLLNWAEELDQILDHAAGPWRASVVTQRYHQAMGQFAEQVAADVGAPVTWVAAEQSAEQIIARLRHATTEALTAFFKIPVDEILAAEIPPDDGPPEWLDGLWERAIPFWRYDETELTENSRARMRLEHHLFLPGGAESPLAPLFDRHNQPEILLAGSDPYRITAVILRYVTRNATEPIETETELPPLLDEDWLI